MCVTFGTSMFLDDSTTSRRFVNLAHCFVKGTAVKCDMSWKKCWGFPQRYVLLGLFFMITFNSHTHITLMSLTLPVMVKLNNDTYNESERCQFPVYEDSIPKLFDSDQNIEGVILSSFYWGYIITYLFGGLFVDELGKKQVFGFAVLTSTVCTLVLPFVIVLQEEPWVMLVIFRVLAGLAEGIVFPAMDAIYSQWMRSDKAILSRLRISGALLGTITSFVVGGTIMYFTNSWALVYTSFGTMGLVLFVIWEVFGYDTPETNPFITNEEKNYLLTRRATFTHLQHRWKYIPWRSVFSSVPFWMLIVHEIGHNWGWYLMVTELPNFLKGGLKFTIQWVAFWSALPFCCYGFSCIGFYFLANYIIKKTNNIAATRKCLSLLGTLCSASFMLAGVYITCDRTLGMVLITLGMGFMSTYTAVVKKNIWDIAPNYGGTLMEVVDACGVVSGMMVPYTVGLIVTLVS